MNSFKTPLTRLVKVFKKSRDAWKAKAVERQRQLRAAQIKIRDLEHSRAYWKARASTAEERQAEQPVSPADEAPCDPEARIAESPPSGHSYPVAVIQQSIDTYLEAGTLGSRGIVWVLDTFHRLMSGAFPPAYTTVLNWVYRWGLAVLNRIPERRDDWMYVADLTIALGPFKCLVILGIPAGDLPRIGYSPSHQAMQVLALEVTRHSTGSWIAKVLERTACRTGLPVQIVTDHGSDLHSGVQLFVQEQAPTCVSTYDISHRIGTLLEAELGQDGTWNAFLAGCRQTLSVGQQSDMAFLLPPRQRTKARFMNLHGHVRWAQSLLAYYDRDDFSGIEAQCVLTWMEWDRLRSRIGPRQAQPLRALVGVHFPSRAAFCQALEQAGMTPADLDDAFWNEADAGRRRFLDVFAWILPYRDTLGVYAQMMDQAEQIQTALKSQGLHQTVRESLQAVLPSPSTLAPRAAQFAARILKHVGEEAAKIPPGKTWLASSDIIESVFGKYKGFMSRGPLKEIGRLVLTIPAFLSARTPSLIREAMETVRTLDIDRWVEKHIGPSMLARRRRALINPAKSIKTA